MKLALIGRSMISPFGLAMRPRMPASWRICDIEPRAPELAIMKIGFSGSKFSSHRLGDLVGRLRPLVDDQLVALLLRDQAHVVLVLDLGDLALVAAEDLALLRRDDDVVLGDRDAGQRRVLEPEVLERVEDQRRSSRRRRRCTSASTSLTVSFLRIAWLTKS